MGRATRWLRSLLSSKKESRDGAAIAADDRREKKRWSFKAARDTFDSLASVPAAKPVIGAPWLPSLHVETENEQSKHAIAVAAATAAAADAAITAAQAAVAVVQLTSNARRTKFLRVREYAAAVMIQRIFRGYLAKKALRALKSLVKLQALARGYLVRKQAAATLYSMQALIRAQAIVRSQKSRAFLSPYQEMFDETRSERTNPFHRRSIENQSSNFDRSPKIVQVDSCRPRPSRRTGCSLIDSPYDEISVSSPLRGLCPQRTPPHDCLPSFNGHEWSSPVDKCRCCSTVQTTPRCINSGAVGFAPPTPAKSVCGSGDGDLWRFQNSGNCPNYMINTRSFEAKLRSKSAPKQRMGSRQRVPLSEVVVEQARASLSGVVRMHRVQEPFDLRSAATVGRLDSSLEVSMEAEEDLHLQKQNW